MKQAIFCFFLVASLFSARADDGGFLKPDWMPDAKTVTAVDKEVLQLRQPKNLPPLTSYSPQYMGAIEGNNRRVVVGILISPTQDAYFKSIGFKFDSTPGLPPSVYIVSDRGQIAGVVDGGCGAQEFVVYDIALKKFIEARCNGIEPLTPPQLPPFLPPVAPPLAVPAIPPSISITK